MHSVHFGFSIRLVPAPWVPCFARTIPPAIVSSPPGARVFVDNREYGRTPVAVGDLTRGAHSVRITRDGYVTDERPVTITSTERAHSVTVQLAAERTPPAPAAVNPPAAPPRAAIKTGTGLLSVESHQAGAKVFIDGRFVGTTPLRLPDVPAGEHALHLDHDGYIRWSSSIRIVSSAPSRVTASLDR